MSSKRSSEMQNLMVALLLSMLIMFGWQYYIETPRKKAEALAMKAKAQVEEQVQKVNEIEGPPKSREELITASPRLRIESSRLHGSIALKGLRLDDLTLARFHETLDPKSPDVVLFSPSAAADGYFTEFGWPKSSTLQVPDDQTLWAADSETLSPDHPVTLSWKNKNGVTFSVHVALDDKYMFAITQSATDAAGKKLSLQSYAYINRAYDITKHPALNILHEGPLGVFDGILQESPYKKLKNENKAQVYDAQSGWLGISDKYWLSAIVPPPSPFTGNISYYESKGRDRFQVDYLSPRADETNLHFFAGPKELNMLDDYAAEYNIPLFNRAIDFGWFWFLTIPIFKLLTYFHALVGNFGIAIMILTVLVKAIMFPLANKQYASMNRMKQLQPKMKEIQERCKDDKVKLNKEIMELYKREKVNPASGCLPVFVQIPVFFALYKVLYVTIEMRQAPFFGWIHDLSVSDPTNLFTLFGLVDWHLPAVLHLGLWPMIMCATMVIQQHQSPPPPDPTQAKMMKFLPFFFLFMFSSFPAGLVIYWCWSNTLTILQQAYIAKKHGVKK